MTNPERLCIYCKHFSIDLGEPGYSEYTPGSDFSIDCRKKKWEFNPFGSETEYRLCIVAAQKCDEYVFDESLKSEVKERFPDGGRE